MPSISSRFLENKVWQTITLDNPELGIVAQKMDAALASHTALFQRAVIDALPGISTYRFTGFFAYPDVALASSFLTLGANVRLKAERVLWLPCRCVRATAYGVGRCRWS